MFKESIEFKGYDWEQFEKVILYSLNYKINIKGIRKQYKYLIFECGYGCDISMRLIKHFEYRDDSIKSDNRFIRFIEDYRLQKL